MDRRDLLRVSGLLITSGLGGCASILSSPGSFILAIHNDTKRTHTVDVFVDVEDSGGALFDRTFELDGGTATRTFPIEPTADCRIEVTVDEEYTRTHSWNGSSCEDPSVDVVLTGPEALLFLEPACDNWF